jgi:hypothetical protein
MEIPPQYDPISYQAGFQAGVRSMASRPGRTPARIAANRANAKKAGRPTKWTLSWSPEAEAKYGRDLLAQAAKVTRVEISQAPWVTRDGDNLVCGDQRDTVEIEPSLDLQRRYLRIATAATQKFRRLVNDPSANPCYAILY